MNQYQKDQVNMLTEINLLNNERMELVRLVSGGLRTVLGGGVGMSSTITRRWLWISPKI